MPKTSFLIEDILDSPAKHGDEISPSPKYKCFKKRALNYQSPNSVSPASSLTSSSDDTNVPSSATAAAAAAAAMALDYLKQHQVSSYGFPADSFDYSNWQSFLLSQYYSRLLASSSGLMTSPSGIGADIEPTAFKRTRRVDDQSGSSTDTSSTNSNISPKSSGDESSETGSSGAGGVSPLDALLQLANSSTFVNKHMMDRKLAAAAAVANGRFGSLPPAAQIDHDVSPHLGADLATYEKHHPKSSSSQNTSFESKPTGPKSTSTSCSSIPNSLIPLASAATTNPAATPNASGLLKRKRKNRTAFTATQIFELERRFSNQRYLSPHDRDRIAHELSLSTAQVITWFQNRRAKQKRDIEELKNDVIAAKTLKQIDPDVDVDKIVRAEPLMNTSIHSTRFKCENRDTEGEEYLDDEEIDIDDRSESDVSSMMNNSVSSSLRINSTD